VQALARLYFFLPGLQPAANFFQLFGAWATFGAGKHSGYAGGFKLRAGAKLLRYAIKSAMNSGARVSGRCRAMFRRRCRLSRCRNSVS
jgi:hypothetical protein